ncbi:MAG: cysteine desulfurase [Planctomycetota bacterium]|nr:cysteine desulfurase [Planctomycetota bacterium]
MTAPTVGPIASTPPGAGALAVDVEEVRRDFPILSTTVNGKPLVYLDNAASTQKPRAVIERITKYYSEEHANIHRGIHHLSQIATQAYEDVRSRVKEFLGASRSEEIVFVRGTTEAVNLVVASSCRRTLRPGDEIVLSGMEHHSNIVPWQMVCQETGAKLRVAPVDDRGDIRLDEYRKLLGPRTRFVAVVHVSNALGTVNPVREMIAEVRKLEQRVPVLVDGAQAVAHMPVDVREIDCDFYAFSGHKLFGPTGVGALYGRYELLDAMSPYQGGGEMILSVTWEETTYNKVPYRFEAGTPNIAGVVGLGAAIDYVEGIGLPAIARYEKELLDYATRRLLEIEGLRLIGDSPTRASILGFVLEGIHPHDIGTILDQEGIAVRAGHHCAQPVMQRFGVSATVRASIAFYNTREEIDRLVDALRKVNEVFG